VAIEEFRPEIVEAQWGTLLATAVRVADSETKSGTQLSALTTPLARPACDEWGFYDPEQAGFEAVMRKLASRDAEAARATHTRVVHGTK
jgi:hypothetical protein